MITKQTTPAQRTHENSGTARSWRKMAAGIGLAAGALSIVLALLTSGQTDDLSADPALRPAPVSRDMPVQHTWSAYDGGAYGQASQARRVSPNVPIQHTWSAYDGGAYGQASQARRVSPNVPIQHTWSAYDGQTHPVRVTAPSSAQGWPGATPMGSAYNGQPLQAPRRAPTTASGWPGATPMGSAYNGQ
jgi:hypothetical protein